MDNLPIVLLDEPTDEPPITFNNVANYVWTFIAGFGACAVLVIFWLAVVWLERGMK